MNRPVRRLPHETMALICTALALLSAAGCESPAPAPEATVTDAAGPQTQIRRQVELESDSRTGKDLYTLHCSACHGATGDGMGIAARHLYPKPRNFRGGGFRLVTTTNLVPTAEDLKAVIARGMPGSSMPEHRHLSDADVTKLVREILRIRREGIRNRVLSFLREETEEEEIDEQDVETMVGGVLTPGPVVNVPRFSPAEAATIAKGKEVFLRQVCPKCHGPEGRGDGDVYLIDDQGNPVRPRDFVYGFFKGGNDPESIYVRVSLGMPGSPMPASVNLSGNDLIALVHYVRSLSREPKHRLTNYQRSIRVITR